MTIQPTNPFHIARAYASARATAVPAVPQTRQTAPVAPAEKPARDAAAPRSATFASPIATIAERTLSPNMRRLVAATVPGGIDFSGAEPVPTSPSIPMYRHPADRNAAATALTAGRRIDIEG